MAKVRFKNLKKNNNNNKFPENFIRFNNRSLKVSVFRESVNSSVWKSKTGLIVYGFFFHCFSRSNRHPFYALSQSIDSRNRGNYDAIHSFIESFQLWFNVISALFLNSKLISIQFIIITLT